MSDTRILLFTVSVHGVLGSVSYNSVTTCTALPSTDLKRGYSVIREVKSGHTSRETTRRLEGLIVRYSQHKLCPPGAFLRGRKPSRTV